MTAKIEVMKRELNTQSTRNVLIDIIFTYFYFYSDKRQKQYIYKINARGNETSHIFKVFG